MGGSIRLEPLCSFKKNAWKAMVSVEYRISIDLHEAEKETVLLS